jgi:hypothetical protein
MIFLGRGSKGRGKTQNAVILSEAKNLSWFLFSRLNRREILRFAQNDKSKHFFRSLFSRDVQGLEQRWLQPLKSRTVLWSFVSANNSAAVLRRTGC